MTSLSFYTRRPWLAALGCLLIILLFHSPRWWLIIHESLGTFEWSRALNYLRQCQAPLTSEVEPAMRWRFVPQIFVYLCGGGRGLALCLPWVGAWAFLWYIYVVARTEIADDLQSIYITLLVGSSAPVFVSTGWLGVNDAWFALGLSYLAFGRRRPLLVLVCCLCPFIDERFIFGLPIALLIRLWRTNAPGGSGRFFVRFIYYSALGVMPFIIGRVIGAILLPDRNSNGAFLLDSVKHSGEYLWMAPLGAWMALRFAYLPAVRQLVFTMAERKTETWLLLIVTLGALTVGFTLAADTTRTAGILVPLAIWGTIEAIKRREDIKLPWLVLANLLVPAAHVTMVKVSAINSLPVELWRVWR